MSGGNGLSLTNCLSCCRNVYSSLDNGQNCEEIISKRIEAFPISRML